MPEATATRMTSIWPLKPSTQGETIIHRPSAACVHSSQARGTNTAPSDTAISASPATTLLAGCATPIASDLTVFHEWPAQAPRTYRFGYGVFDTNLNGEVDPGEKKVYFEFSDYSTSYVFYESPR